MGKFAVLFHTDEGKAVALGEDELLASGVTGHVVIEATNGLGLGIVVVGRVDYMAIPQGVVGQEERSAMAEREEEFVVFGILALIGIDKGGIDAQIHRREEAKYIAHVHLHTSFVRSALKPRTGEGFLLIINLKGNYAATSFHARGHGQGGIARISANLYHRMWALHLHEHAQELSLQVAGGHARAEQMQIGGAIEAAKVVVGGRGMVEDVLIEGHGGGVGLEVLGYKVSLEFQGFRL